MKFYRKVQKTHHPHQGHQEGSGTDIPKEFSGLMSAGETGSHSAGSLTALKVMFSKITEAMWWYLTSSSQRAVIIITYGKAEGQPRGLDSQGVVELVSNMWGSYGKNRQQPAMTVLNPPRRQEWTVRRWGCLLQKYSRWLSLFLDLSQFSDLVHTDWSRDRDSKKRPLRYFSKYIL